MTTETKTTPASQENKEIKIGLSENWMKFDPMKVFEGEFTVPVRVRGIFLKFASAEERWKICKRLKKVALRRFAGVSPWFEWIFFAKEWHQILHKVMKF